MPQAAAIDKTPTLKNAAVDGCAAQVEVEPEINDPVAMPLLLTALTRK